MRNIPLLSAFLILLIPSLLCAKTNENIRFTQVPYWVIPESIPEIKTALINDIDDGTLWLLQDHQENIPLKTHFYHYAWKVISDAGVQNSSDITVNFDPSYETLEFHKIHVIRNNIILDKSATIQFKLIQRETSISTHIYDGRLSAVVFLEDIRKNDIIEYCYSIRGSNPIFSSMINSSIYFQWTVPIIKVRERIFVPTGKKMNIRTFGSKINSSVLTKENIDIHTWKMDNVPKYVTEDFLPVWYNPYISMQVTDISSWSEVVQWALPLYEIRSSGQEIKTKISELKKIYPDEDDLILSVIRFVQDEIRYMGIEIGKFSYQPLHPDKVFTQRFGDCKDKSLLLCSMLHSINIKAFPVLTSTYLMDTIQDLSPSPTDFNHVVVLIRYKGKDIWIDPTISYQRGSLFNTYFPDYRKGLIIMNGTHGLIDIPRMKQGFLKTAENFTFKSKEKPGTLDVTTVYEGEYADNLRYSLASKSITTMSKNYLDYYVNLYTSVNSEKTPVVEDDIKNNRITIQENYKVKNLWKLQPDTQKWKADFYVKSLEPYLTKPDIQNRKDPIGLPFPKHVIQTIAITIPENWNIKPAEKTIHDDSFIFSMKEKLQDKTFSQTYEYIAKSDSVRVSDCAKYIEKIGKAYEQLSFYIIWPISAKAEGAFRLNTMMVTILIFLLVIFGYGAFKLYSFDPLPPSSSMEQPEPIGGWLILVAIAIYLSPLLICKSFFDPLYFNFTTWQTLNDPNSSSYSPGVSIFILMEFFFNTIILVSSVFFLFLFVKKRRTFPLFYIIYLVFSFIYITVDVLVAVIFFSPLSNELKSSYSNIWSVFIRMVIWVPYMLISKRVKTTFVTTNKNQTKSIKFQDPHPSR